MRRKYIPCACRRWQTRVGGDSPEGKGRNSHPARPKGASRYPSTAALLINPRLDAMGEQETFVSFVRHYVDESPQWVSDIEAANAPGLGFRAVLDHQPFLTHAMLYLIEVVHFDGNVRNWRPGTAFCCHT